MKANQASHPVRRMCSLLGVSPSGYYAWLRRPPSAREQADRELRDQIVDIHSRSRGTYGAPRIHAELAAEGVAVGRKRVARLMRQARIQGVHRRRSLTWDQGAEMAQHAQLRVDADLDVYFCDPQSPWQRGTNENTNGLLRQYFPKGTDLTRHSRGDLDAVAAALNGRPRKTLGYRTPAEALTEHLHSLKQGTVATTP